MGCWTGMKMRFFQCWDSINCCSYTSDEETEETERLLSEPELAAKEWYRGSMSNDEADNLLDKVAQGHDGSYIVYDSPVTEGQYILLVYHKGERIRWKIQQSPVDGKYILGEDGQGVKSVNRYKTVKKLIKAHRGIMGKPIVTENGGVVTLRKM